jgi:hypothetical protein
MKSVFHSAGRLLAVWMPTDYYCPLKGGKILAQEARLIQPFSTGQTLERAKWQRACAYDTHHKSRHCPLSLLTCPFASHPSLDLPSPSSRHRWLHRRREIEDHRWDIGTAGSRKHVTAIHHRHRRLRNSPGSSSTSHGSSISVSLASTLRRL